jgi:dynein heavy chain
VGAAGFASLWLVTIDQQQLEHLVHYLPELGVHPDFLLWLTMEPTALIPSSVLRAGVKMRDVAPHGVKAKLLESFRALPPTALDEPRAPRTWRRLLLGLALFHAIVQVGGWWVREASPSVGV